MLRTNSHSPEISSRVVGGGDARVLSDSILDLLIEFVCWLKSELVSERVSEREKVLVSV